jgi:SAM-dependent methyltransferase
MSECPKNKEWFASWFDTKYYHLLYAHRTYDEAAAFIHSLLQFLKTPKNALVLDLACGKGRHSVELANHHLRVVGVDLSPCSILEAQRNSSDHLRFEVQDMRNLHFDEAFDAIFNLFTSFGYFDGNDDNALVLGQVFAHLKNDGVFVLDYFNAARIDRDAIITDTIIREGVTFETKKWTDGDQVFKEIIVTDGSFREVYQERVQLLTPDTIATLLQNAGFRIFARFGNYQLDALDEVHSPRCIMVATKSI